MIPNRRFAIKKQDYPSANFRSGRGRSKKLSKGDKQQKVSSSD
ncbi:hypothetical protein PORCRE_1171 [Porphyromonas crevioricanis JCM 15906]|uniref:Uncharacterized protein n=1 Tax=Porphyromonas crevioricanis JCM 15906 TaxID=1305617 RepID=T1DSW3_9PORP|nr:hypothetical protein PORCRE_1171 [Porphyromonas crevioricanis JCM 15906]